MSVTSYEDESFFLANGLEASHEYGVLINVVQVAEFTAGGVRCYVRT